MIDYRAGDIFEADVEALVNAVNCVGVMGRGLALQFKNRFPENYLAYEQACRHGEVQPGQMFVFETGTLANPKFIFNFPTKRHWRDKSRIEDINSGLKVLAKGIHNRRIKSIAIPPLGCGLGGLDWADVRVLIEEELCEMEGVKIVIFEPKMDQVVNTSLRAP